MADKDKISDIKQIGEKTYVVSGYGAPSNQSAKYLPKFKRALRRPLPKSVPQDPEGE